MRIKEWKSEEEGNFTELLEKKGYFYALYHVEGNKSEGESPTFPSLLFVIMRHKGQIISFSP